MSKQKIDETMTEARNARAKRSRTVVAEASAPEEATEAAPERDTRPKGRPGRKAKAQAAETTPAPQKRARGAKAEPDREEAKEDLVVFAFRLTERERELIHKTAGPAKASRFARKLMVAAANGDDAEVKDILEAVRLNLG